MISTVLSDLLSNAVSRAEFDRDRERYLSGFPGLSEDEQRALVELNPAAVERQAHQLLDKRLHEVAKLAPRTKASLGDSFRPLFHEHGERFNPKGHRRHLEDAIAFLRFLASQRPTSVDDLELALLEMSAAPPGYAFDLRVRWLRGVMVGRKRRTGLGLLFRSKRQPLRFHFFYLSCCSRVKSELRQQRSTQHRRQ